MALVVEDGTGIAGAESYASVADTDAYWQNRSHSSYSSAWAAATTEEKEGALREASAYLDAVYGLKFRGYAASSDQGRAWPRVEALDNKGFAIEGLPAVVKVACMELAGRAVSAPLVPDYEYTGAVKSVMNRVGPISESIEYANAARLSPKYGVVEGILAPVLRTSVMWEWS